MLEAFSKGVVLVKAPVASLPGLLLAACSASRCEERYLL